MITNPPCNQLFFPKLKVAKDGNAPLEAACVKIEKKLEQYALSRGIKPDELRLFDVCDADGELHSKVRLYIDRKPKLNKQTPARYEKYKEEILSNIQRAIDAVFILLTGAERKGSSDSTEGGIPALLRHENHVLTEIYDILPRQRIRLIDSGQLHRGKKISENGFLFYLSCVEAFKYCSPSSLSEFLTDYRHLLSKSINVVCISSPEKIEVLKCLIIQVCKKAGIKRQPKRKRRAVEDWPSPLREEMKVYRAVAEGRLMEGLEEKLADSNLSIKISNRIRPATLHSVEATIELLLYKYCTERERLSVRDLLTTTMTEGIEDDGSKKPVYYNAVLSPYRESEKARTDEFKRSGKDSVTFDHTVTYLLSLAAYNGIFEYHEIIRKAFKIKIDIERIEQRKAEKKAVIKRQGLDQWIEDNWPEYERILTQGLFKRNRGKRSHTESDRNMRFVLHYCRITTMKVMGFRQRQIRDSRYGLNLIVTQNSVEFTYPAEKTKKSKPLHFRADMENCSITHGRLIYTLDLFYRFGFPYVQANLEPQQTNDDQWDRELDSAGQFFVHLRNNGKFVPFDLQQSETFTKIFRGDCRRFLKHPDLQNEAALMIHPHYVRGAAMDTQIEDNGMPMDAASRYFGASEQVINSKYKDRNATQDASRDLMLLNAEIEDLEGRKKRNRSANAESHATKAYEAETRELRRQLYESKERVKQSLEREHQKDARIAKLEQRLDKMQTAQDKHHEEIMKELRGGSNGRATRKSQPKRV